MASRYFCHQCQQSVGLRDTDMLCGQCGSDFIEQMQGAGRDFTTAFRPPLVGNQGPIRPRLTRFPSVAHNYGGPPPPRRRAGTPPPMPAGNELGSLAEAPPTPGSLMARLQGLISNHLRRRPQGGNHGGPQQGTSGTAAADGQTYRFAGRPPIPPQHQQPGGHAAPQQQDQQQQAGPGGLPNQPVIVDGGVDDFLRVLNNIFASGANNPNVHFQIHIGGGGEQLHGNLGDYAFGNMDRLVNDLMNQFEVTQQVRHLSEEELARIPMTNVNQKHVDNQTQCSTCFETFALDEPVAQLNCEHIFHRDCVVPWLRQHKTCPMCRNEVDASEWEAPEGAAPAENNAPPGAPAGMVDQDELD